MSYLDANSSVNALADIFRKKYGKDPTADELVDYGLRISPRGTSIFDTWDTLYDGDKQRGNSISPNRYYANGDNLLFQTVRNDIVGFDLGSRNSFQMTGQTFTENVMPGVSSSYSAILGRDRVGLAQFNPNPINQYNYQTLSYYGNYPVDNSYYYYYGNNDNGNPRGYSHSW